MATGPSVRCEGGEWTLVFDGTVDGELQGAIQCPLGVAYMRVETTGVPTDSYGFLVKGDPVPVFIRDTEKVYCRPVNRDIAVVIMG